MRLYLYREFLKLCWSYVCWDSTVSWLEYWGRSNELNWLRRRINVCWGELLRFRTNICMSSESRLIKDFLLCLFFRYPVFLPPIALSSARSLRCFKDLFNLRQFYFLSDFLIMVHHRNSFLFHPTHVSLAHAIWKLLESILLALVPLSSISFV